MTPLLSIANGPGQALSFEIPEQLVEAVARRAAAIVCESDRGFLDIDGACGLLGGCSRKRIYHLVEREQIPFHRAGGRLLFDRRELRNWVESER